MNTNIVAHDNATMSSFDIAALTEKDHSEVVRSARALSKINVIQFSVDDFTLLLDKRNSLVLVANLSPKFTAAVIDRWQELESAAQQPAALPGNYIEALQALIESEKGKAAAQEQLAIAAPKVEFHDTVVNSTNTFSTRDAAKKINQRPIKFGWWLKDKGYLCLNGRAAQKYIEQGLFVTHTGISDSEHAYTQTRMTGKGCAYFANKLFEIKL